MPTSVVLPGAGGFGLDFLRVHELVARQSATLLYDRAGTGWSDDAMLPRTLDDVTDELRRVLDALGIAGPVILVGHSLGGAYAQRYAQRFGDQVVGLVLIDPLHQDWNDFMPESAKFTQNTDADLPEIPPPVVEQLQTVTLDWFDDFPAEIRSEIVTRHLAPARIGSGFREGLNVIALLDELRGGGSLPELPTTLITATGTDAQQRLFVPADQLEAQMEGSRRLYAELMRRHPSWRHIQVADASHATLPMLRPDVVAIAVADVVAKTEPGRLRRAVTDGDKDALDELVEHSSELGDLVELRRLAASGSDDAVGLLVEFAIEREDIEELRRLSGEGSRDAAAALIELDQ
ncbi:MAG: alpha/beta fold hydrolase [Actinobacteria bacterium]|nr:alpha/beta fold hydrolase [Actinomycetota bacterium]